MQKSTQEFRNNWPFENLYSQLFAFNCRNKPVGLKKFFLFNTKENKQYEHEDAEAASQTLVGVDQKTLMDWQYRDKEQAAWQPVTTNKNLLIEMELSRTRLTSDEALQPIVRVIEFDGPGEKTSALPELEDSTAIQKHYAEMKRVAELKNPQPKNLPAAKTPQMPSSAPQQQHLPQKPIQQMPEFDAPDLLDHTVTAIDIPTADTWHEAPPDVVPSSSSRVSPVIAPDTEESAGGERRKTQRFNSVFRIMLACEGDAFITQSENVSLGGIKLAHPAPQKFVGKNCEVFIMNLETRESLQLVCLFVAKLTDNTRISFIKSAEDTLQKLDYWLQKKSSSVAA